MRNLGRSLRALFAVVMISALGTGGVAQARSAHVPPRASMSAGGQAGVHGPAEDGLLQDVAAISSDGFHICALTHAGGIKCWGSNRDGNLGDGSIVGRSVPVDVVGLTSGVTAIAGGGFHTCALLVGGAVKCWGYNYQGQLGDGTNLSRITPVQVVGLGAGAIGLAAGYLNTCAVMTGGGVKCWGDNSSGQLGDGTTENRNTPVDVVGLASGVAAVTPGWDHTCARLSNGTAKCWGDNAAGQLGDGTHDSHYTPVDVLGLPTGVAAITVGWSHTCAVTPMGGARCWGRNNNGELGDGTTTSRSLPVDVVSLTSGVAVVNASFYGTCAVTTGGALKCWGENADGQVGDGTLEDRHVPTDVTGLANGVMNVERGARGTCALLTVGQVKCWGSNQYGAVGNGAAIVRNIPMDVSRLGTGVGAISSGGVHTCVVAGAGVKCWGRNSSGGLGDGSFDDHPTPVDVVGLSSGISSVSAGAYFTCARTVSGGAKCWGKNVLGSLGDGTNVNRTTPVDVVGLTSGVGSVVAGGSHACAVTSVGAAKCWGANWYGQLGDDTTTNRNTPVDVVGLGSGVSAITTGSGHTCALMSGGGVKCWGDNSRGELGDGTTIERHTPVDVIGLSSGVIAVEAGYRHTCAVMTGGAVKCWGANESGELGDGTTTDRYTPVDVTGLVNGSAVSTGEAHSCARTADGRTKCWGANANGELGDGTYAERHTPTDVSGLAGGSLDITAASGDTCALVTGGRAKCWGGDGNGELGLGNMRLYLTPVDVVGDVAATLLINYPSGQPGSFFTLTGQNFAPGATVSFVLNGGTAGTTVVNEAGGFIAFLSTTAASEGYYFLVARVDSQDLARVGFKLQQAAALRAQEGGGQIVAIPPGIGLTYYEVYLPSVGR